MELKVVIGAKEGKSYQKELKGNEADVLHNLRIGDKISGDALGFTGYEFMITGGSDKAGFPMRKGIQEPRKKILTGKGVGFSGEKRNGGRQKGLQKRRTVCGERITKAISQINLKIIKEGPLPLAEPSSDKE